MFSSSKGDKTSTKGDSKQSNPKNGNTAVANSNNTKDGGATGDSGASGATKVTEDEVRHLREMCKEYESIIQVLHKSKKELEIDRDNLAYKVSKTGLNYYPGMVINGCIIYLLNSFRML